MVQNVRYSNGPPNHVTLTFEYQTVGTRTVRYSDESDIQVFSSQMVTVLYSLHKDAIFSLLLNYWRYHSKSGQFLNSLITRQVRYLDGSCHFLF